jgi:hypothetical protein
MRSGLAGWLQTVAPGSSLAGLAMARELRDAVPRMIVLAERSDEMVRLGRSLPEADAFLLKFERRGACRSAGGNDGGSR